MGLHRQDFARPIGDITATGADPSVSPDLARAIQFVRRIGIPVHVLPAVTTGFLPHVAIVSGELNVGHACQASDLLHEAGHLALIPGRFRRDMNGDLSDGFTAMFKALDSLALPPDEPLNRAALQCSDPEATAWAWAAGTALGLPPETIITDDAYDGEGASIRQMLSMRLYLGIHGLIHAGLCLSPRNPGGFPALTRWLQDW